MGSHRGETRRVGVRPSVPPDARTEPSSARGVSVEEDLVPDVDELPKPAGFGTESSTSTQSFTLLDEYTVPAGTLARLREASLNIASNGEAKISVAGTTYGPFTGSLDVAVPLDPGVLTPGHQIRVFHQSTDGTAATQRAQVVVLEV